MLTIAHLLQAERNTVASLSTCGPPFVFACDQTSYPSDNFTTHDNAVVLRSDQKWSLLGSQMPTSASSPVKSSSATASNAHLVYVTSSATSLTANSTATPLPHYCPASAHQTTRIAAVSAGIGGLLILAILAFLFEKRRNANLKQTIELFKAENEIYAGSVEKKQHPSPIFEAPEDRAQHEILSSGLTQELDGGRA